jgi:hypothetical protein
MHVSALRSPANGNLTGVNWRAVGAAPVLEPILPEAHGGRQWKVVSSRNQRRVAATDKEASMALARVVTFDGVSSDRMNQMRQEMQDGQPPEGLEPQELIVLHDADSEKAIAIVFFEDDEKYRSGDAVLSNMDPGDTPGQRTSVGRYDVAMRMSM